MRFAERHWFDVGAVLGIALAIWLIVAGSGMDTITLILWISLLTLFAHQVEEWRWPGWFPGMLNVVLFRSDDPWRYPLNVRSGLVVNVVVGWVSYLLAALFGAGLLWLAMATILVSVGNCVLHLLVIPIRGRMPYNPGMATSLFLFLPVSVWFFIVAWPQMSVADIVIGLLLGVVLNVGGVIGVIRALEDRNALPFEDRQVKPALRYARAT
ncbi:MAG TPA: HXXEE domain-containing protein [Candidatus Nanopelagicales bacterium]|nr:HXXEE domain-containing protein [Candidatus Nanopelagicales bacterium]